jgi:pimeloyl-ACP methyl ester carboxylesterase
MDPATFAKTRLDFFAHHGFVCTDGRIADRVGRQSYIMRRGDGSRPTLLIHGGLSEASEWFPIAAKLPEPLVIPDRPGCGLSYRIDYRGVDYRAEAASWLQDLVEGVGAETVDLVGNSMGGYFAMAFATAHPDRVRRLVLVGAPAGLDREIPLILRLWGNPIVGPFVGRLVRSTNSAEALRERVFTNLVVHPEALPLKYLELALAALRLPGADVAAHTMLRAVLTVGGWRRNMLMRDDLAHLQVPTLFVWGNKDAFAAPTSGQEMTERMPNASIKIIPDAGHKPYLDQADEVASSISNFLQ